jgi:hypothetical protein
MAHYHIWRNKFRKESTLTHTSTDSYHPEVLSPVAHAKFYSNDLATYNGYGRPKPPILQVSVGGGGRNVRAEEGPQRYSKLLGVQAEEGQVHVRSDPKVSLVTDASAVGPCALTKSSSIYAVMIIDTQTTFSSCRIISDEPTSFKIEVNIPATSFCLETDVQSCASLVTVAYHGSICKGRHAQPLCAAVRTLLLHP